MQPKNMEDLKKNLEEVRFLQQTLQGKVESIHNLSETQISEYYKTVSNLGLLYLKTQLNTGHTTEEHLLSYYEKIKEKGLTMLPKTKFGEVTQEYYNTLLGISQDKKELIENVSNTEDEKLVLYYENINDTIVKKNSVLNKNYSKEEEKDGLTYYTNLNKLSNEKNSLSKVFTKEEKNDNEIYFGELTELSDHKQSQNQVFTRDEKVDNEIYFSNLTELSNVKQSQNQVFTREEESDNKTYFENLSILSSSKEKFNYLFNNESRLSNLEYYSNVSELSFSNRQTSQINSSKINNSVYNLNLKELSIGEQNSQKTFIEEEKIDNIKYFDYLNQYSILKSTNQKIMTKAIVGEQTIANFVELTSKDSATGKTLEEVSMFNQMRQFGLKDSLKQKTESYFKKIAKESAKYKIPFKSLLEELKRNEPTFGVAIHGNKTGAVIDANLAGVDIQLDLSMQKYYGKLESQLSSKKKEGSIRAQNALSDLKNKGTSYTDPSLCSSACKDEELAKSNQKQAIDESKRIQDYYGKIVYPDIYAEEAVTYEERIIKKRNKLVQSAAIKDDPSNIKKYEEKTAIEIFESQSTLVRGFYENNGVVDNKASEMKELLKKAGLVSTPENFPKPGQLVSTHDNGNGDILGRSHSYLFSGRSIPGVFPKAGNPDTYGSPEMPYSKKLEAMLNQYRKYTPGSYKFFIEKLHGRHTNGDFYTKNPIKQGLLRSDIPNRMVFPAYIENYNDSYDADWSPYNFYGRSEPFGIYKSTSRKLSISFFMVSDFSTEMMLAAVKASRDYARKQKINSDPNLKAQYGTNTDAFGEDLTEEETLEEIRKYLPEWGTGTIGYPSFTKGKYSGIIPGQSTGTPEMLWSKLTFLAQCMYPWYRNDGKMKEQPIIRIRIGDFIDATARVTSLSVDDYEKLTVDLNPSKVGAMPMGVTVSMSMDIIHEDEPSSNYFKFYHRKDFDTEDIYYIPDCVRTDCQTTDSDLDGNSTTPGSQDPNKLDEALMFSAIEDFKKNIDGLNSSQSTTDLKTAGQAQKAKETIRSANNILKIQQEIEASKLPSEQPQSQPQDNARVAKNEDIANTSQLQQKYKAADMDIKNGKKNFNPSDFK